MIKPFLSRQFVIFLATGGTAALLNFFSRIYFDKWFSYSISVILSYLLGMLTAFLLAKVFVFKKSRQTLLKSMAFFCAVNALAILQTWTLSMLFAFYILPQLDIVNYSKEIAHAIGIVVPVFTSYLGHKYWSFR